MLERGQNKKRAVASAGKRGSLIKSRGLQRDAGLRPSRRETPEGQGADESEDDQARAEEGGMVQDGPGIGLCALGGGTQVLEALVERRRVERAVGIPDQQGEFLRGALDLLGGFRIIEDVEP